MGGKAGGYAIRDNLAVPEHEVWFEFSHASGPGGQNVNKVATVATLCFALAASGVLSDAEKRLAATRLANRIAADGVLRITSRESRSQSGNRMRAAARFRLLLAEALKPVKKRRPTRPSLASRERRLADKHHRARRKAERGGDGNDALSL